MLDLACGRGGDLNKLNGCRSYVGVDNACDALAELQRRARELAMPVTVHCTDASVTPAVMQCNLAICNFALHYFCDTQEHLVALLDTVSACLVAGGAFCGTYERTFGKNGWGVAHHALIGDCVNALEWRVPWPAIVKLAWQRGMAVVQCMPFSCIDTRSDHSIVGFIMQKAQVQCYDKTVTGS